MAKSYKYQCRPCPPSTRDQCIEQTELSPGIRRIVRQAFLSQTDTEDTWDSLQPTCLLVRLEQASANQPAPRRSALRERIQQHEQAAHVLHDDGTAAPSSPAPLPAPQHPSLCYPAAARPHPSPLETPGPRILVSAANGHRILLPEDGDLILGRFDPEAETHPDVDLTLEDRLAWGISRRHARIIGWRGQYEIEDLGSRHGTWVNEAQVAAQSRRGLHIGDEVRLGGSTFYLDRPPTLWQATGANRQFILYVTLTGRYYPLPPQNVILIGRADPHLNLVPDIDLSDEDDAIAVVSRRHAKLTLRGEQWMIEDMGSTFKTQVNGQKIYAGIKVPIYPGQHIWLGGYTLAFDVLEL